MGENSDIEWTDHTFNPWVGCAKISPACDHCYAEVWSRRAGEMELWRGQRRRTEPTNWKKPARWNRDAIATFGRPARVFCASLADVFDNEASEEWRRDLFALILDTPNLRWQLLTKRIGNAGAMIGLALVHLAAIRGELPRWPWPNVWLGSTVVTQAEANRDLPKLLRTLAHRHFLSIEPMLGAISMDEACNATGDNPGDKHLPDWIIVGGESGGSARPMSPAWVDGIFGFCKDHGVPFFFKQWGEWAPPEELGDLAGLPPQHTYADGRYVLRVGKKRAGRTYLERTHDEFPEG